VIGTVENKVAEDVDVMWFDFLWRLFAEILNKEVNCTEIQFTEDGNWRPMRPDSDEYFIPDSPSARTSDNTVTATESDSTGLFLQTFQLVRF